MYPNLFLKTFWKTEIKPQIFVAMSFDDIYKKRFDEVIAPAIESISIYGNKLKPYRVDLSKTGDSILTDIIDGIAHSEMVLADVSTIGYDSKSSEPYRNANVMYEVGLALACRNSSEILIIKDDNHKFLFDVSTIPHKTINFTNPELACNELKQELLHRLNERDYINDARIELAIASLTSDEKKVIEQFSQNGPDKGFGYRNTGTINFQEMSAFPRLLDKQIIKCVAIGDDGQPVYVWTRLGFIITEAIKTKLPIVQWAPLPEEKNSTNII